jgi:asparagine synthase (glutamine-hydrolysing)
MCGIWGYILSQFKDKNLLFSAFSKIKHRGPDRSRFIQLNEFNNLEITLGFHRLAIMDKYSNGDQPFVLEWENRTIYTLCNGEIYNYKQLIKDFDLQVESDCDCEVIPLLYEKFSFEKMLDELNGEFAIAIIDINHYIHTVDIFLARDPLGVRPMFYSQNVNELAFCSELKGLSNITTHIEQLPTNAYLHYRVQSDLATNCELIPYTKINYNNYDINDNYDINNIDHILHLVRDTLELSVIEMLNSDRPLGALLSGGLDSSLVVSIAANYLYLRGKRLRTFSIGMPGGTDEQYARMVSEYLNTDHTHIELTNEDFLGALDDVIYAIESYDITTVRASTGQYLICKWIAENTDIKVLLIGDGSDELTAGYLYFHNAPNGEQLHNENVRLLKDIKYFDVLRADRCVAAHGLEARVPYLNYNFVNTYLGINPELRMANHGYEKWLLRKSFEGYLPDEVLWRRKEAFSDGVSSNSKSWYTIIQESLADKYSEEELTNNKYIINTPTTYEGLYYRQQFVKNFGDENANVIPYFWMPKWCGDIGDPSARFLEHYEN